MSTYNLLPPNPHGKKWTSENTYKPHEHTDILYSLACAGVYFSNCTYRSLRTTLRGLCSPYTIEVPRTKFRYSGFVTLLLTSEPYCWHQSFKKNRYMNNKMKDKAYYQIQLTHVFSIPLYNNHLVMVMMANM